MQVLCAEIKLVIVPKLIQILQIIAKHKTVLIVIAILKAGFIRLKIILLFHLLFNHIFRHSIASQSMEFLVNNLQDRIVIHQMDICALLTNI
jgi:hypothetical protein